MAEKFFRNVREREIFQVTLLGTFANTLLMLAKFVAGIWGHSSALIADAANSLSDLITDITMLFFVRLSCKPSDKRHRYGHGKYETLASACVAIAMIVLGASFLADAAGTVNEVCHGTKTIPIPRTFALWVALSTIVTKFFLFVYTRKKGITYKSSSLNAKAFDHRNDVLTSLAAVIGIVAAMLPDVRWAILEPIAAGIVSIIIIYTGVMLLIPALEELMEKSLPEKEEQKIHEILAHQPSVLSYHKLHTRSIGSRYAIEVDIRVHEFTTVREAHNTTKQIEDLLRKCFGAQTHVIIHVEPEEEKDRDEDLPHS